MKGDFQMKHNKHLLWLLSLVALTVLLTSGKSVNAQEPQGPTFSKDEVERAKSSGAQAPAAAVLGCTGPITRVIDVGNENLNFTSANYFTHPGGGEGGGFDKTPVLSTKVSLAPGVCLDAHLSAIVGSGQTYRVAPLTLFQVTLTFLPTTTPPLAGPRHMVGHFEHPFGTSSPAVALEAERDVDMFASNFFQKVGSGPHEVRPGTYRVDVWWAGAGPGGAIGAAFVLKLYVR
jgi:hypothetical protein